MTPNCTADKCASVIPPTATDTLTGFTQGTYNYYCEYHFAMRGTFIVQALPAGPDFVINSSSTSLTIDQGSSQTSTLTISSLNGYSGTVNLTLPNTPAGISAKFLGSSSFSITASTAGSASLNITVAPRYFNRSYTLPIAGSNGTTSHTTNLSVQVTSASPASSSGLPAFLPVIVGIVIVGVMGTAAYAVLRRRPGKKGPRASR